MDALCYVAYPTSLTLKSANAVQTYLTVRELRTLYPRLLVVIPRLLREPSEFEKVGVVHLPRIPVGKMSRFFPGTGWYYIERSLFAWMVALYLFFLRLFRRRRYASIYVREVICAYWLARWLRPLTGTGVVYEVHELESRNPSRAKGRLWQPILRALDRVLLSRADGVVSLTSTFAREVEQLGWRRVGEIEVLPDAYDGQLYGPMEQDRGRRAAGIPLEQQVVVYSGLTFSYRGLEHLLAAMAQLAPRFPRLWLYLVGGRSKEIAGLQQEAQRLAVAERVVFVGTVSQQQVPAYLAAADMLVIPGTVSGASASPLKMFEYMAVERPIVTIDIPALREILDDDAAYFVPPGNETALAEALERVLLRPEEARQRAAQARERAADYTYRRRAERLLGIVRKTNAHSRGSR
jgi:glycosyltransferase involved in cell wall biosynthesis